jgi:hypothetical protein
MRKVCAKMDPKKLTEEHCLWVSFSASNQISVWAYVLSQDNAAHKKATKSYFQEIWLSKCMALMEDFFLINITKFTT